MPMEIAEIEGNKEAIEMLKEFAQQKLSTVSSKQPAEQIRFNEPSLDAAIQSLNSIVKYQLSDANQILQQMKSGVIPCGIWHSFSHRLNSMKIELQELIEQIQNQMKFPKENEIESFAQNANTGKQREGIENFKTCLRKENQIAQYQNSVEILKKCEIQCLQSFNFTFGDKSFQRVEWDDVGLFMNLVGLSSHYKQIQQLECTPERAFKLLTEDSESLDFDIRDKMKLKFANHMIKQGEQLPFEQHFANCSICRQPAQVFLKEYFPAGTENKKGLETYQLMMVSSLKESTEVFGTQYAEEALFRAKQVFEFHSKKSDK